MANLGAIILVADGLPVDPLAGAVDWECCA